MTVLTRVTLPAELLGARLFLFFFKVYFFEKETEKECQWGRGSERGGERERTPSRPCAVSREPEEGLDLTNQEIMT